MVWSTIIKVTVVGMSVFTATFIYKKWPELQQDNIIEETIEEYLEDYTGYDVDLSWETKES